MRLRLVHQHLKCQVYDTRLVCSDHKLVETFYRQMIIVLSWLLLVEQRKARPNKTRTWMSMKNTTDENWDKGAPSVCTVVEPGQSHTSSGIMVLRIRHLVDSGNALRGGLTDSTSSLTICVEVSM